MYCKKCIIKNNCKKCIVKNNCKKMYYKKRLNIYSFASSSISFARIAS